MGKTVHLHLRLMIGGAEVEAGVAAPAERAARRVLLPILRNLADTVTEIAGQTGAAVSCRKGCDACCRQMVPISPAEAYGLAELLEGLAAERAGEILGRFEEAREKLEASGLMERLVRRHELSAGEQERLDRDYFAAQVACPFLEGRACSIYGERPLACREFLVTSPAEYCGNPTGERVVALRLAAKVLVALAERDQAGWLPLVLAREFVAEHGEEVPGELPAVILRGYWKGFEFWKLGV